MDDRLLLVPTSLSLDWVATVLHRMTASAAVGKCCAVEIVHDLSDLIKVYVLQTSPVCFGVDFTEPIKRVMTVQLAFAFEHSVPVRYVDRSEKKTLQADQSGALKLALADDLAEDRMFLVHTSSIKAIARSSQIRHHASGQRIQQCLEPCWRYNSGVQYSMTILQLAPMMIFMVSLTMIFTLHLGFATRVRTFPYEAVCQKIPEEMSRGVLFQTQWTDFRVPSCAHLHIDSTIRV